jgi:hypothetical protein
MLATHGLPQPNLGAGSGKRCTVVTSFVTCRWHVRLDVSGFGRVADSAEVSVLVTDPEPLLT